MPRPTGSSPHAQTPDAGGQQPAASGQLPDASTQPPGANGQRPTANGQTPDAARPIPNPRPLDPAQLWAAALEAVGRSNASAWMSHFRLARLDTAATPHVAYLAPAPGAAHARGFATGPRLARVAETLTSLTNAPVRVELEAPPPPGGHVPPDAAGSESSSLPEADAGPARPGSRDAPPDGPARPGSRGDYVSAPNSEPSAAGERLDRRTALNLPLVRDVFAVFPEVTLIDARREAEA